MLVPIFNGADVVHQAIDNILCQTLAPREIVLADDGSDDGLSQAVANLGIRCEQRGVSLNYVAFPENRGRGAARNLALDGATGDLVAWYDVDDLWAVDKLAEGVASFNLLQHEYPEGQLLLTCNYCRYDVDPVRNKTNIRPPPVTSIDDIASTYKRRHVQLQTVLGPRTTFLRFRFDEELNRAEDFDFALRFTAAGGKFINPNWEGAPLVYYFRSTGNSSREAIAANRRVIEKRISIFRANHVDPMLFLEEKLKRLLRKSGFSDRSLPEYPRPLEAPGPSTICMTRSSADDVASLQIALLTNGDIQFYSDTEHQVRYSAVWGDLTTVVYRGCISLSRGIAQSEIAFWFLEGARVLEIEVGLRGEFRRERFRLTRTSSGAIAARASRFDDLVAARTARGPALNGVVSRVVK